MNNQFRINKCGKCGLENQTQSKFCMNCGVYIPITHPENDTEIIRWKIYRYAKDKIFWASFIGFSWFVVGIAYLLNPKSNITEYLPLMVIMFLLAGSGFIILFLLERRALDKYPFHLSSRFRPYPVRSFEGGITFLIMFCMIIILFVGRFLVQNTPLETEYFSAFLIAMWPVAVIHAFITYRMYKKRNFLVRTEIHGREG